MNLKKTLSIILALAMICLMAACGAKTDAPAANNGSASADKGGEITLAFVGPQTGDNASIVGFAMVVVAMVAAAVVTFKKVRA